MMIIDPPGVMYGPPEAIEAWLATLATYPQDSPQVQSEIRRAQEWLASAPGRPVNVNIDLDAVIRNARTRQAGVPA